MTETSFVTVVTGLPRTGTSMMMRMLEAGGLPALTDGIRRADQDNPNGYYELEAVKRLPNDVRWLTEAGGRAVKIVYALLRFLPGTYDYRVVLMRRNLDEVLASQARMLQNRGEAQGEEGAVLAAAYERQLAAVRTWLASQSNVRSVEVDYNALLSDPGPGAEAVATVVGGLDVEAMCRVVDPQLYRQRS